MPTLALMEILDTDVDGTTPDTTCDPFPFQKIEIAANGHWVHVEFFRGGSQVNCAVLAKDRSEHFSAFFRVAAVPLSVMSPPWLS